MRALFPVIAVLAAGLCAALQAPTNGRLATASGSVLFAALVSFAVGTAALLAIWLAAERPGPGAMAGVPGWAWLGGLYGAVYVAAMAYAVPSLGIAAALSIVIAAQLAAGLAIDGLGLFGLDLRAMTPTRVGGVVLVAIGVVLTRQ